MFFFKLSHAKHDGNKRYFAPKLHGLIPNPSPKSEKGVKTNSVLLFQRFRGHPAPAVCGPTWQLPLTQPSQALANFAPTAPVLILKFVFPTTTREV